MERNILGDRLGDGSNILPIILGDDSNILPALKSKVVAMGHTPR
jgi:hypothetical protein